MKARLVAYVGTDEVLVCRAKEESQLIATYFNDPKDRDIGDYDRMESKGHLQVVSRMRCEA